MLLHQRRNCNEVTHIYNTNYTAIKYLLLLIKICSSNKRFCNTILYKTILSKESFFQYVWRGSMEFRRPINENSRSAILWSRPCYHYLNKRIFFFLSETASCHIFETRLKLETSRQGGTKTKFLVKHSLENSVWKM